MQSRRTGEERTNGFFALRFFFLFDTPPPEMPTDDCSYCNYDACEATAHNWAYRDDRGTTVVGWLDVRCSGRGEDCGRYDRDPVDGGRGARWE